MCNPLCTPALQPSQPLWLAQDPVLQLGTNLSFVCVGDEWHRFPSSFHLPHPAYRLAFVASGFHGLLPRPFNTAQVNSLHTKPGLFADSRTQLPINLPVLFSVVRACISRRRARLRAGVGQ